MSSQILNLLKFLALAGAALGAPTDLARPSSVAITHPGPGQSSSRVQSSNGTWPWQTYETSSLNPPNLNITSNSEKLSPGYVLLAPKPLLSKTALKMTGSFIMDQQNQLVYGMNDSRADNFRVQEYKGTKYLTFWENTSSNNSGHGYGSVRFLDAEYKQAFNVCVDLGLTTQVQPPPKCQFDQHEQLVTARNTLVVSAYNYTQADLTSAGGAKDGWIFDAQMYEVDIETGKVLFSWSSLAHVPISRSRLALGSSGTAASPYDWFHINSIEMVGSNFLINSRNCWETYLVSGADGHIIWRFNAQDGGSFAAPSAPGNFSWQHYVRAHNASSSSISISYFDNANSVNSVTPNATRYPSRGLVFELALPASKSVVPKLLRDLQVTAEPVYVGSQGLYDVDVAGTGNQFMGYGQIALMREYGPATDGSDLRWEARFGPDNLLGSYRVYKQQWHGTPAAWNPSLVVRGAGANATAGAKGYVSWNGATEVKSWRVCNGQCETEMTVAGEVPVRGFETEFNAPTTGCVMVEAVMANATRKSNIVCI